MNRDASAAVFWALSDPLRIELLDRIAANDGATVSTLAHDLPITRQAVARHLQTLETAALLCAERRGRERLYSINAGPLADAGEWLSRRADSWGEALHRLAAHVEEAGDER